MVEHIERRKKGYLSSMTMMSKASWGCWGSVDRSHQQPPMREMPTQASRAVHPWRRRERPRYLVIIHPKCAPPGRVGLVSCVEADAGQGEGAGEHWRRAAAAAAYRLQISYLDCPRSLPPPPPPPQPRRVVLEQEDRTSRPRNHRLVHSHHHRHHHRWRRPPMKKMASQAREWGLWQGRWASKMALVVCARKRPRRMVEGTWMMMSMRWARMVLELKMMEMNTPQKLLIWLMEIHATM